MIGSFFHSPFLFPCTERMGIMRFLHTSDWHLGRIFHGLHLLEDQMAVLGELMSIIREEKIDALFIAGDIYDRSVPPTEAVRALDEILVQLVLGEKIPTVIIAGNHDNPDRLNFGRALFASENLFITGPASAKPKPVILSDKTGPIYVAPLPYCEPLTATELSGDKKTTHEAALSWQIAGILSAIPQKSRKIALSHTFVTGAQVTPDSERPLAAGGSSSVALSLYDAFPLVTAPGPSPCPSSACRTGPFTAGCPHEIFLF